MDPRPCWQDRNRQKKTTLLIDRECPELGFGAGKSAARFNFKYMAICWYSRCVWPDNSGISKPKHMVIGVSGTGSSENNNTRPNVFTIALTRYQSAPENGEEEKQRFRLTVRVWNWNSVQKQTPGAMLKKDGQKHALLSRRPRGATLYESLLELNFE